MKQSQSSIFDTFIALFKLLPTETQVAIKEQLSIEKTGVYPVLKGRLQTKFKLSSLRGKVSKMTTLEIDKQINLLRNEWRRDI